VSFLNLEILVVLTVLFINLKRVGGNQPAVIKSFPLQESVALLPDQEVRNGNLPAVVAVAVNKDGQMA